MKIATLQKFIDLYKVDNIDTVYIKPEIVSTQSKEYLALYEAGLVSPMNDYDHYHVVEILRFMQENLDKADVMDDLVRENFELIYYTQEMEFIDKANDAYMFLDEALKEYDPENFSHLVRIAYSLYIDNLYYKIKKAL